MKRLEQIFIKFLFLAIFGILIGGADSFAQQTNTDVPEGQKTKVLGYILTRDAENFTLRAVKDGQTYDVKLTPGTSVRSNRKGVFRGNTRYEASFLLRGLRVEVEGVGDAEGMIVAKSVRFNETDLRSAQTLDARIEPLEDQTRSNTERLGASEENQKRLSGQISEVDVKADVAAAAAIRANNRINGLEDWELVRTIVVPFASGSSTVGPKGRTIIDEAAKWAETQDRKGWMVAVVGFADSTGRTAANKVLSERRANSVIAYMISKHDLPLQRLIQPFGAGVDRPVASNETRAGRAQNRRVEIHLLRNVGIAGQE